jgi:diacylglycerol kinase family enzyme
MTVTIPHTAQLSPAIMPRLRVDGKDSPARLSLERLTETSDVNGDADHLAILVNTSAGGYKFFGRQRLEAALKRSGHASNARIVYCTGGQLKAQAQALASGGAQMIGVFGGDGSARTVALALRGFDVPLLPLPGGTLNRLCHRVHGHDKLDQILGDLKYSNPVWLSGGMANEHMFLVAAGFGPWMAFHEVRETVRSHGLVAGLIALRAIRRNLFAGKLSVNNTCSPSDVIIAAPDYVDQAFGFGPKSQNPPIRGLEVASVRFGKLQRVFGLGLAVLTNSWRKRGHVKHNISSSCTIECSGEDIFGLVDGETCQMGKVIVVRHVPRAALVVSTRRQRL